jgi:WD40 repeat protein
MRSVSSSLELMYWDVPAKRQIKRVDELQNAVWHSFNCKLGWYAKGVLQASGNEHTILSIDVMGDHSLMAVSTTNTEVRLFHFPCLDASATPRSVIGHAPLVTRARFSSDARRCVGDNGNLEVQGRLITLGGKDQSILQWRLLQTILDPLVQVLVSKAEPGKPLYQVPNKRQLNTAMVKGYGRVLDHQEPPASHLELDFVHGYGGHNNNANLFVVKSGDLLYNAGALCVVFDPITRSQMFFCEHQNEVMAMALHPDALHVASADAGSSPAVCVWNAEALVCVARLDGGGLPGIGGFESGVSALAFSPDGKYLAAVGSDKDHTLYLLDWREKRTIAAGKCGSGRVLACTFSPYDKSLITCGVNHVKFWTSNGHKMIGREGVFGKFAKKCTMQCVDVNPANFVQHAGQKSITFTGGMDGGIYMFGVVMHDNEWRPEVLNQRVMAHKGPVFDIRHDALTLLVASCGADGLIRTWTLKTFLNPKDKSKTELDLVPNESVRLADLVAGLPIHVSVATFAKSILLTRDTQLRPFLLIGTNTDEILRCFLNAETKVQKDEKTHLPVPAELLAAGQGGSITDMITCPKITSEDHEGKSQPSVSHHHAFSVGIDHVLKMWDTNSKCLVAAKGFEEPIVSVDFAAENSWLVVGAADGTVVLLNIRWQDPSEDGVKEPGRWVFEEISQQKAKGPVTLVRFSGEVMGERFLAVGRRDGLIDFFSVKGDLTYVETSRPEGDTPFAVLCCALLPPPPACSGHA